MKYMMASDIDGTLYFSELESSYKQGDLQAIKKFQDSGHLFGVCTGRPLCHFDEIRQLNLDFYIVSSGAILLDKNFRMIEDYPMQKELANQVFDEYKHKAEIIVQTGSYTKLYATFEERPNIHLCLIKDFDEIRENKIYGISLVVDSDETASFIKKELDRNYPQLEGFQNKNSIDIVKKGCSKGMSIQRMGDLLQIHNIAGIGDSYNDMSLIQDADIGFTFYNSPKEVQNHATYVVDSIEQAIEILMEEQ